VYDFKICIIDNSLFVDYPDLKKEANSKATRIYLGVTIKINNNNYFIPFESKLHKAPSLVNVAQYAIPSNTRPNGGLNFEKALIINESKYIKETTTIQQSIIANSQKNILLNSQKDITTQFESYIKKYIKACKKGREKKEFIFKFSTLHHFKRELNIE